GPAHARGPAYIFTEADIAALIRTALTLPPAQGLRPRTYATLLGLLACTGLRIAEALALRTGDLDWGTGVLTVRRTKFNNSRLVLLHPSAIEALRDYAEARDLLHPSGPDAPFFVSDAAPPLPYGTVRHRFHPPL